MKGEVLESKKLFTLVCQVEALSAEMRNRKQVRA